MTDRMAVKVAIDLLHVPSQVRRARAERLPDDVLMLLRIAAGDQEAERSAAGITGRSPEVVRRSAMFFIEQILFAPGADSYRVLGADARAGAGDLRRNAALLLRWLHPDRDAGAAPSIFAGRVTDAWNNLKTPERRAAYDAQRRSSAQLRTPHSNDGVSARSRKKRLAAALARRRSRQTAEEVYRAGRRGFLRRTLSFLFDRPL